jgi:hypothetical protein
MDKPSLDEWRSLYAAAVRFRDLAPWQWMYDSDLFGVVSPETGQTVYCCVMGNLGEHFALAAYRGSEGLLGYMALQATDGDFMPDPLDILMTQDCLMASFENRSQLDKQDLAVIRSLGLKFRGASAWPQFRDYLPGHEPWYLTAEGARSLTVVLEQAVDVATRLRTDPNLLPNPVPALEFLIRVPARRGTQVFWHDEVRAAPPPEGAMGAPILPEPRRLEAVRVLPRTRATVEMDLVMLPSAVRDGEERPFFPYAILTGDPKTGTILGHELTRREHLETEIVNQLFQVISKMGAIPAKVQVELELIADVLGPTAEKLGIKTTVVRRLKAHSEARAALFDFMAAGY